MEKQTDSALMKRVQEGDTGQLAELFERHHLALYRYLLQLSRNQALSEDLVQEVFFRVLKYASSFDTSLAFPVWLYRMARNAYFDALRKRQTEVPAEMLNEFKSDEPEPEEISLQREDSSYLREALRQLPPDKREVLVLSRFHELRYHEIAQILKCEIPTVKVRVYRALRELREKFCELRGERLYDV